MLRKYYAIFLLLGLFLVACGGATAVPTEPQQATPQEASPKEAIPEQVIPTDAPSAATGIKTEPEILPVAAKPQLIEFYADW